jgi:hypothetical protein
MSLTTLTSKGQITIPSTTIKTDIAKDAQAMEAAFAFNWSTTQQAQLRLAATSA